MTTWHHEAGWDLSYHLLSVPWLFFDEYPSAFRSLLELETYLETLHNSVLWVGRYRTISARKFPTSHLYNSSQYGMT
jgi:hypothetical protein